MYEEIYTTYLLQKDMAVIQNWAAELRRTGRANGVGISFRPAGGDTLKCLERGAGAKPHKILDKTLKKKEGGSLSATKHNEKVKAFFDDFTKDPGITNKEAARNAAENLLKGLVGHWNENGVDGLYLTSIGYDTLHKIPGFEIKGYCAEDPEKSKPYLVLNDAAQKIALISYFNKLYEKNKPTDQNSKKENKAYYLFTRLFFSGDYDIHDFVIDKNIVLTLQDEKRLKSLQAALTEGRKEQLRERYDMAEGDFEVESAEDYQRVQHGPQYNYTAQMLNENNELTVDSAPTDAKQSVDMDKINILVESVMNMDFPVAIYDNDVLEGKWKVLSDAKGISDYYSSYGLHVKDTWENSESRQKFIKNNIKRIIRICYPTMTERAGLTSEDVLKKVPQLKQVYGDSSEGYVQAALREM